MFQMYTFLPPVGNDQDIIFIHIDVITVSIFLAVQVFETNNTVSLTKNIPSQNGNLG